MGQRHALETENHPTQLPTPTTQPCHPTPSGSGGQQRRPGRTEAIYHRTLPPQHQTTGKMKYYIHPYTLRLSRLWIFDDGIRSCCRVAVKFGIRKRHAIKGTSVIMSPGEARQELNSMEKALLQKGYWPLWFWLLCCSAYVIMATQLLSFIFNL